MSVLIANINGGDVTAAFAQSLAETAYVAEKNGWGILVRTGLYVPELRDDVARHFIEQWPDKEWLLFIDSDMAWQPIQIQMLLDSAEPYERPVVNGLAFSPHGGDLLLAVGFEELDGSASPQRIDWAAGGMRRVVRTGCAFLLIHRMVLVRIREAFGRYFQMGYTGWGPWLGEDYWFCDACRTLEIPIHVNCDVRVTHWKRVPLGHSTSLRVVGAPSWEERR